MVVIFGSYLWGFDCVFKVEECMYVEMELGLVFFMFGSKYFVSCVF